MNDMHRKGTTAPGTWTRMISFLTFMLGMGVAQFLQAHQYSALMNLYNELGCNSTVCPRFKNNEMCLGSSNATVACSPAGDVVELSIQSVPLSGTIPTGLWRSLTGLASFSLGECRVSGTLPTEIGLLTGLTALFLQYNRLSGTISREIGQLRALTRLYLNDNVLSGTIPSEIGGLTSLVNLRLYTNKLTGTIPSQLGLLSGLTAMQAQYNDLSGTVPTTVRRWTALGYLSFSYNELSGSTWTELLQLDSLTSLYLDSNQLGGMISSALGHLSNLRNLFLRNNLISGTIPHGISLLTLGRVELQKNALFGAIPDISAANCVLQDVSDGNCFDCANPPLNCKCETRVCTAPTAITSISNSSSSMTRTTLLSTTQNGTSAMAHKATSSTPTMLSLNDVASTTGFAVPTVDGDVVGGVIGGTIALLCVVGIVTVTVVWWRSRSRAPQLRHSSTTKPLPKAQIYDFIPARPPTNYLSHPVSLNQNRTPTVHYDVLSPSEVGEGEKQCTDLLLLDRL